MSFRLQKDLKGLIEEFMVVKKVEKIFWFCDFFIV